MSADMHNFTHDQIAAVLADASSPTLHDSLDALDLDLKLEAVRGSTGLAHIDADGSSHGLKASVKRTIQEEQAPISMLADALEDGQEVLFVHDVDGDNVDRVAEVLADGGATLMFHFSDLTWRRVGQ